MPETVITITLSCLHLCFSCSRRLSDVSTVTLGWVGALNQRYPFRLHGGVVGFVDRCHLRASSARKRKIKNDSNVLRQNLVSIPAFANAIMYTETLKSMR